MPDGLEPGHQVFLEWYGPDDVYHAARSALEEVRADQLVFLAPLERGHPVALPPGTAISVVSQGRRHAVLAEVRAVRTEPGDPPLLVTTAPTQLTPTTPRRFVRVPVELPATLSDGRGWLMDLSATGCLLRWVQGRPPDPGTTVTLQVTLPPATAPISLTGRVVRVEPARRAAGLDFVGLDRRTQEAIIRYVARRQSELLRQGLLGGP